MIGLIGGLIGTIGLVLKCHVNTILHELLI
nr:MAG TPA: hypothetical protein [Caudoviricetes sp.]